MRVHCGLIPGILGLTLLASSRPAEAQDSGPRERQGFWIGFGLGPGSLSCDDCSGSETSYSGNFRLGGTISRKVLLGFESNAWYKEQSGVSLTMANASAVVIFYPSATGGFHLKGGLGVSRLEVEISGLGGGGETGAGALLGIGYDFRAGRNFSLTPFLNGLGGNFDGGSANFWQVGLGLSWH